jgi:hypothetical protein
VSWGDFLESGRISKFNKTKEEFTRIQKYVKRLNLKSSSDWCLFCKSGNKPNWIPSKVKEIYSEQWNGWPDFLGYE